MQNKKAMCGISVIICTYNRDTVFAETLDSFSAMDIPSREKVELLIIDNHSTDKTPEIAKQFIETNPYSRYIYEPQQGLSHARNRGIKESRGNIIAFVDDDVYFERDWLKSVVDMFERVSSAAAFGGKSIPLFEGGRPEWMNDAFLKVYGDTQFGEKPRVVAYPDHPFGLNMAFRKEVFESIGEFNIDLGRKKTSLLSNEESDLFERISKMGLQVFYEPSAVLYHRIPKDRVSLKWIRERSYWQGISDVVQKFEGASRLDHLRAAVLDLRRILGVAFGTQLSIKKIYWKYKSVSEADRVRIFYLYGAVRQHFGRAFK